MSEQVQPLPDSPLIAFGQVARLRVAATTSIGAFLDWGLEKELLLPFAEQTRAVNKDELVNVALYLDKSGRPCATMKIYPYLATDSPYLKNAEVEGEIYEISQNFGAFVAVDYKYSGLIPAKEIYRELKVGEVVSARVAAVKPDGKLDLALRKKAYLQMSEDAGHILGIIAAEYGGILPFTDKTATPEDIRQIFAMSKNEFKRAIGGLLKEKKIRIDQNSISLLH
jgi:predicted RNA-binding protein (virulence factor B family)